MIGPFFIPIKGRGITRDIFLFFVYFFRVLKFIVEIKLIIFLFLNLSFFKILCPT